MARAVTTVDVKGKDSASATYQKLAKNANKSLKTMDKAMTSFGKTAKTVGVGIATYFGAQAIGSLKQFGEEFAQLGIETVGIDDSFKKLTKSSGLLSSELIGNLQRGAKGAVSEFEAMAQINKALLLDLPITAENIDEVAMVATGLGRAMQRTANEGLSDLLTGLGRGSAMILDNLGIVLDQKKITEEYAESLGISAKELDKAQKKQAIFYATMEAGTKVVSEMGGITEDVYLTTQQLSASWDELKRSMAEEFVKSEGFQNLANVMKNVVSSVPIFLEATKNLIGFLDKIDAGGEGDKGVRAWFSSFFERTSNAAKGVETVTAEQKELRAVIRQMNDDELAFRAQQDKDREEDRKYWEEKKAAAVGAIVEESAAIGVGDESTPFFAPINTELTDSKLEEHDLNQLLISDYTSLNDEMMRNNQLSWDAIELADQEKAAKERLMIGLAKQAAATFGIQAKYLAPIEIYGAIKETALGLSALSSTQGKPDPASAALHFTSSLKHVAAAKALMKGGGGGGGGGRGGGGGGARNSNYNPYDRPETDPTQQNATIIVNNTMDDQGFSTFVEERGVNGIVRDAQNGGRSVQVLQREMQGGG